MNATIYLIAFVSLLTHLYTRSLFDCRQEECLNFAKCNQTTGKCGACPKGIGGDNCSVAECGSLFEEEIRGEMPLGSEECVCNRGWKGLNCNVCDDDSSCYGPFGSRDERTICEKSGLMAKEHYRSCVVSLPDFYNRLLGDKTSRVMIDCRNESFQTAPLKDAEFTCLMQYWFGGEEQFYCSLSGCKRQAMAPLKYACSRTNCKCIPKRKLCDSKQLIDISSILQQVKGNSFIRCTTSGDCLVWENTLGNFLDGGVKMQCQMGECMNASWVSELSSTGSASLVKALTIVAFSCVLLACTLFFGLLIYLIFLNRSIFKDDTIELPSVENNSIVFITGELQLSSEEQVQTTVEREATITGQLENCAIHNCHGARLAFENIRYSIQADSGTLLNGIYGIVEEGSILGIIGGSGSGKTTLLDILACKSKKGIVTGDIFVNGRVIGRKQMRKVSGFVEQEDILMGSLTVKEFLMYSAFLRLPKEVSDYEKKKRVFQTMHDLGIAHLAERCIGIPGRRGISGGEKRRLMIAQELITRPKILFLDEPTSGLDSYTALSLVKSLHDLSKSHNTTIIMTIHQPRSNIFNMLDNVLLLGYGEELYFGRGTEAKEYFKSIGYSCPESYNIGDYMLDVAAKFVDPNPFEEVISEYKIPRFPGDEETNSLGQPSMDEIHFRTIQLREQFFVSDNYIFLQQQLREIPVHYSSLQPIELTSAKNAFHQFCILSCRTMTNIFRNPLLLASHWFVSAMIGTFCGLLFWHVTNDMAGVQNRLGCLFFTCAFFAFSSVTSLEFFSAEKTIFIRERSNGFYGTMVYFISKVLFDIFPLRIVPPILYGSVVYKMAAFYRSWTGFFKFLFALVMFNLASSAVCLLIGIAVGQLGVANLIASIFILISMLFGGFLLNKDKILPIFKWIKYLSIFNYAYEAMIVNELTHVTLTDNSIVDVKIPGSVILRQFGFDTAGYNFDLCMLVAIFCTTTSIGYLAMRFLIKETK